MGKWGSKKLKRVTHSGAPCVAKEQIGNGVSEFVMANVRGYARSEGGAVTELSYPDWFDLLFYCGDRNVHTGSD